MVFSKKYFYKILCLTRFWSQYLISFNVQFSSKVHENGFRACDSYFCAFHEFCMYRYNTSNCSIYISHYLRAGTYDWKHWPVTTCMWVTSAVGFLLIYKLSSLSMFSGVNPWGQFQCHLPVNYFNTFKQDTSSVLQYFLYIWSSYKQILWTYVQI